MGIPTQVLWVTADFMLTSFRAHAHAKDGDGCTGTICEHPRLLQYFSFYRLILSCSTVYRSGRRFPKLTKIVLSSKSIQVVKANTMPSITKESVGGPRKFRCHPGRCLPRARKKRPVGHDLRQSPLHFRDRMATSFLPLPQHTFSKPSLKPQKF